VHEVFLECAAERDLKALPFEIFRPVIPEIRALAQNPRAPGCHKIAGSKRLAHPYGNNRVVSEVDDALNHSERHARKTSEEVYR
jgi:hypothetical protein